MRGITMEMKKNVTQPKATRGTTIPGEWIQSSNGKWWYRHTDGGYTANGWEYINGYWYFFDPSGWMYTGMFEWNGKQYYCDPVSGKMQTNCWIENLYYFGNDGAMLVNTMTPDGYTVGPDGKWDGREKWVTRLQRALLAAGYNPGNIDGIPGTGTLNACPTLQAGSQGALVKLVQERLSDFFHIGVTGGIDGSFGDGTEAAVIELQHRNGLSTDGIVGRATWSVLLGI